MDALWIPISVFAALMQAVRTAGQKTLNERMSTMGTTYVRSLVGLPIMIAYLALVMGLTGGGWASPSASFLALTAGGALAQVLATALLISLFRLRNFAVGTMLTKSDIVITACIGTVFFSESLDRLGWIALFVVLAGVVLMLAGRLLASGAIVGGDLRELLLGQATLFALGCALLFSFSYLFLREATLQLGTDRALWRAAWTVVWTTGMQAIGLGAWLLLREPAVFGQLWPNRRISGFIGLTSALGSIGWFTAFALENASYVRAVGQIEAVFTLSISWLYFREQITRLELLGIGVTVLGVLMFRLL